MGRTSSKVKQKYNDKVYHQVSVRLQKELVEQWESQIAQDGISKAAFIRDAIVRYLQKKTEE
ncbi:MAG TPA: ribbon-helix-helix domain-containing protein [Firmicutes bacterium]|nr:ribbon-helix-helix domain-containing protein [Bacillota bacterium]